MRSILKGLGLAALTLTSACASVADTPEAPPPYLEKDLTELADLMEGRWDNDAHVFFAEAAGLDTSRLATRQHLVLTPLSTEDDAPQLEAVRTVEGQAPIMLIHTLSISEETGGLLQRSAVPQPSDLTTDVPPDCLIDWERRGEAFVGTARAERCEWMFGPVAPGAASAATLTLSKTEFWVESSDSEARLRRARSFSCWTAVLPGVSHGESGEGRRDWLFERGVEIHDQGGVAYIAQDDMPERNIRLKLRDVVWPYGTNRPSLTLYVYEGDSDRALSYAWAEGGAERIGINLRWLQASCTHASD